MAGNCSDTPLYSEVYLRELSEAEKASLGVSTALCIVVLLLFADKVFFIHHHYDDKAIKHKSLMLVGLYPVVAVASLLAVYIPRSQLLCNFLSTMYLKVCLYEFTSLIVLYFGGTGQLLDTIQETGFTLRVPPFCCCCFCCPTLHATQSNLTRIRMMVMQTAVVQPVVSFVSLVLLMDGKYNPVVTSVSSPAVYLLALNILSTLLAVYGLLVLFRSTHRYLATHNVMPKFLVMQLVLILLNVQKLVMRVLADNGVPACVGNLASSIRADTIHHMLVIAEMCLLAFFARMAYRKSIMQEMTGGYTSFDDNPCPRLSHNNQTVQNGCPGESVTRAGDHRSYNATDNRTSLQSRHEEVYSIASYIESD